MSKISVRSMFVAPEGKLLVAADLSQAESWVVAYKAREMNMQYSLNYSDIHTDSAAALFNPDIFCQHDWLKHPDDNRECLKCGTIVSKTGRYIGKRYNHASAYRMKPPRAAQVINKDSDKPPYVTVTMEESKTFSKNWHTRYNLKIWWAEIEEQLNRNRTLVTTYGRSRTFFAQWGDELFKEATAFEPQSTVADHFNGMVHPELGVEGGLIQIYKKLIKPYPDRRIINQSHDSFMAEVPKQDASDLALEAKAMLLRPMVIHGVEFTIPVDAEIGERWGELKTLKAA